MSSNAVLVVATVLEGASFPPKLKSMLYVTCKFAGELLNSDEVPHTSAPYFNTELAWELSKKTLHQHRLQRTPLKLAFFTKTGTAVEEIGHIMLDLRSVAPNPSDYKWYPLARCKYRTHKPTVRLLLSIESPDTIQTPVPATPPPRKIIVSLDEASGCYQVGSPSNYKHVYVLSITVIAAARLHHLIAHDKPDAFSFRFNLLDNLVTNSAFVNALQPDFPMERVSVKLRGQLDDIYSYLATASGVSIQLNQGPTIIGLCEVPMASLIAAPTDEGVINSLHDCYTLSHPDKAEVIASLPVEDLPAVEVSFTLRLETSPLPEPVVDDPNTDDLLGGVSDARLVKTPSPIPFDIPEATSSAVNLQESNTMWLCNIALNNAKLNVGGRKYIRYVYPFFGTSAPHSTSVVKFIAGDTTPLPPSACGYSFAAMPNAVHQQFNKVPIVLQMWCKGGERDVLEGTAVVSLAPLLKGGTQHLFGMLVSSTDEKLGNIQMSGWLEEKGSAPVVTQPEVQRAQREQQPTVDRPEYKAALEMELWKELQQEEFLKELEEKGEARMKQISVEWKRKETAREDEIRRQVTEYNKLKEKMKKALKDLEQREVDLAQQERKLVLGREDLVRERSRMTCDVREAARRTTEEFEHKLKLQKQKLAALETLNRDLQHQLAESETRLERRTAELQGLRETQLSAPSTKIVTELEMMKLEKVELERRAGSLEKAKAHYKESWTKALKELVSVREKAQQEAKRRLLQEQSIMEHTRLRYLTLEENKVKEPVELSSLKAEVAELTEKVRSSEDKENQQHSAKLSRLIEERNALLNTGGYSNEDTLIKDIDENISCIRKGF